MISFSIKMNFILSLQIFDFSKGLKNVETVVVNEPSLTHTILPLLCPAFKISFLSFLSFPAPSPPPPPPPPHLALHTKLFPTILRHEFIPMTMENTYQIVFVSLMYFSFSNLPIRRLDRQEKPFLTGPALHVWRTFGSEGEENFWRNVPFRGAV